MERRIKLEDGNVVVFRNGEGAFVINKGYFENGEISKIITMSITDDIGFEGFICEGKNNRVIQEEDKVDFYIPQFDPLYKYLKEMLNDKNSLIIEDDYTAENNKKYIEFDLLKNGINISFKNKLQENSDLDKFNIGIINIIYDGRSKIDQKGLDTKDRLLKFFRSIEKEMLLKKQIEQEDER